MYEILNTEVGKRRLKRVTSFKFTLFSKKANFGKDLCLGRNIFIKHISSDTAYLVKLNVTFLTYITVTRKQYSTKIVLSHALQPIS